MSQTMMLDADPDEGFDAMMGEAPDPGGERPDGGSGKEMIRENPQPARARADLVKRWTKVVEGDKHHWRKQFKRMRDDAKLARLGADESWINADRYVSNLLLRHVSVKTAALYARNPSVRVKRRERLMSSAWSGSVEELQMAAQAAQMGDPNAIAILMDAQRIHQRGQMLDGLARTLELVLEHQTTQVRPPFKKMMKHLVRRAIVQGVGYVKLGFVRQGSFEMSPGYLDATADFAHVHATIDRISADMVDKETEKESPDAERLRLAMQGAMGQEFIVTHEGLTFDFPASTAIIPDRRMVSLTGFQGCGHVTEEFLFSKEQVQEFFGVDPSGLGESIRRYGPDGSEARIGSRGEDEDCRFCVWCIYCKMDGLVYWVLEGWNDFLKDPAPPETRLERFWPWFPLVFNETEDDENPFPPSDIYLLINTQREYNRSRDSLREHRWANRPRYLTPDNGVEDEDLANITNASAHQVIRVKGMQPGQKPDEMVAPMKPAPIDPAIYDTSIYMDDFLRASGSQEATLGGSSNGTATEASIAENSRISSIESNKDDLDGLLMEMFGEAGQLALREISIDQVSRIVGEGAVWPEISAEDIADEVFATVLAGSSGKPNRQVELQNFERLMPLLIQVPGIQPMWLARQAITRLDDDMDLSEALAEGIPSISAMNAAQKPQAGPPGASPQGDGKNPPDAQGAQGGMNAPKPAPAGGRIPTQAPGQGSGAQPMNGAPGGM